LPIPPNPEVLVKIAYKAANELSEAQTASILKQLYGDSFKWGLSADIDVTTSLEEPCSLAEAIASPDAPKLLATCNKELTSIKDLKVFCLVPTMPLLEEQLWMENLSSGLNRTKIAILYNGRLALSSRGILPSMALTTTK